MGTPAAVPTVPARNGSSRAHAAVPLFAKSKALREKTGGSGLLAKSGPRLIALRQIPAGQVSGCYFDLPRARVGRGRRLARCASFRPVGGYWHVEENIYKISLAEKGLTSKGKINYY